MKKENCHTYPELLIIDILIIVVSGSCMRATWTSSRGRPFSCLSYMVTSLFVTGWKLNMLLSNAKQNISIKESQQLDIFL